MVNIFFSYSLEFEA